MLGNKHGQLPHSKKEGIKRIIMNWEGWEELTWKIETASKSNGLVSGDAFFPLRSLHLTLISLMGSNPFSSCFFFITAKRDLGSLSAPLTKTFSKVECILVQSLQQSQLPFGNSCNWSHTCSEDKREVGA